MKLKNIFAVLMLSVFATLNALAQEASNPRFINHRGQDLFISGINVAWMNYGNDLTEFNSEKWSSICDDVINAGGNALRWWIHVDGRSTPTYDSKNDTVIGMSETAIENLALAMDIAATKGVVVSLCLWAHGMMSNDDGDKGTTTQKNRVRRNRLLLSDSVATQRYIDNALIPMVTRLKDHTAILCWEIFNEPEGMTQLAGWSDIDDVEMSDIQRFVNMCAGAIHRTDPNAKVSNGSWRVFFITDGSENKNYYSNEALFNAGKDEKGYLDFYMFHYYPSELGSSGSPFHKTFNDFELQKNTIIGEFPAHGIIKVKGQAWANLRVQKNTTEAMLWLYDNGYSGGFGWTYTAHDGFGGLPDMAEAMDSLKKMHPEHIIVKHDPTFNYIPRISNKIADTVLFKNAGKVENYANANNFFEDDENDVLTYTISSNGPVSAEIAENGSISFSTKTDEIGYGEITVTATDKGGKTISQSFYILVREKGYTSDNKLYKAFVSSSSIEESQYVQFYANDGNPETRWSSEYNDDEYLLFDMLQEESIRRIVLNWEWNAEEKKGAYAQAYTIEVSNDAKTWETVFSVKQGQTEKSNIVLRKDEESPIVCRYIKIHFTERATSWGYSLTEVQAYDFDDHANNNPKITISTRTKYQEANVNTEFKYQILRSYFGDKNYDVLSITAEPLPNWLKFNTETLFFTGTPTTQDTGSYNITIKAEDYFGVTNSYVLEIEVTNPNTAIADIENPLGIFPNPCNKDSFSVVLPNVNGKALASFTNSEGKLAGIKYITFVNGQATCLTDGLAKGVYAIIIRINGETYKSKVIIE